MAVSLTEAEFYALAMSTKWARALLKEFHPGVRLKGCDCSFCRGAQPIVNEALQIIKKEGLGLNENRG